MWSPLLWNANQSENRNYNFKTKVWGTRTRLSFSENIAKCLLSLPIYWVHKCSNSFSFLWLHGWPHCLPGHTVLLVPFCTEPQHSEHSLNTLQIGFQSPNSRPRREWALSAPSLIWLCYNHGVITRELLFLLHSRTVCGCVHTLIQWQISIAFFCSLYCSM